VSELSYQVSFTFIIHTIRISQTLLKAVATRKEYSKLIEPSKWNKRA